jgi:hypothetical protein
MIDWSLTNRSLEVPIMLKKTLLLASMAVAVVTLAVPAGASATWGEKTVSITGPFGFHSNIGGITCNETHWTATLTANTTGHVTGFSITNATPQCTAHGGLAFCIVHSAIPLSLNWPIDKTGHDLTITDLTLQSTLTGVFCPYHEVRLEGDATLTPVAGSNPAAVTTGTFSKAGVFMTIKNGTNLAETITKEATPKDTVHLTPSIAVT